jgi:hypothetical protein
MGISEDIVLCEQSVNELIIKYEQYFLGLEKREPISLLSEVERLARKYQGYQIVNTMMKFKYTTAIARLNSYKQYWSRINRLIEEGKYSRDRFKMEMHLKDKLPERSPKDRPLPLEEKIVTNPEIESLYRTYLEARQVCHLPTDNITREMIAAGIGRQTPVIMEKYKCKGVEFRVVIEEGTPKIKARPKV